MDKGYLILEKIKEWQNNEVTRLLLVTVNQILQTIREGYALCDEKQFPVQKGRELQTLALLDLIEREPGMWINNPEETPHNKP